MGSKIGAKPSFLRRRGVAAANVFAFAVQNNDVPRAKIVAVVAEFGVARENAKVFKIRCGTGGVEFVIAGRRARPRSCAAPGFVVAREVLFAAVRISKVTDGHDGSGDLVQQFGSGFRAIKFLAIGDVTGTDKDCRLLLALRGLRPRQLM